MVSSMRRDPEPDVRGYAVTHPPGRAALPTGPAWNQLVHAGSGSMRVSTASGSWTLPPHRALWLPGGQPVTVTNRSAVSVRTLYVSDKFDVLDGPARVLQVGRFAGELVRHVVRVCPLRADDDHHAALITVVIDQVRAMPSADLWLPLPTERRAVAFAEAALRDPVATTATLARHAGAGPRTLERLFSAETGLSLGVWRRRARILGSIEQLAAGASVTRAAMDAGYSTPSAYVAAFRRELGTAPRAFLTPADARTRPDPPPA